MLLWCSLLPQSKKIARFFLSLRPSNVSGTTKQCGKSSPSDVDSASKQEAAMGPDGSQRHTAAATPCCHPSIHVHIYPLHRRSMSFPICTNGDVQRTPSTHGGIYRKTSQPLPQALTARQYQQKYGNEPPPARGAMQYPQKMLSRPFSPDDAQNQQNQRHKMTHPLTDYQGSSTRQQENQGRISFSFNFNFNFNFNACLFFRWLTRSRCSRGGRTLR